MRPAKVDPVDVASGLVAAFRAAGYAGATMRDLGAATGLKSASLYHRFGDGKAGMALAALAHVGEEFSRGVIEPLVEAAPTAERLRASAAGIDAFYERGALACLLAVLALSDAPPAVVAAVSEAFAAWRAALATALGQAGHADPGSEAEDRIAGIQGALILSRAGQGRDAFARAVARLGDAP